MKFLLQRSPIVLKSLNVRRRYLVLSTMSIASGHARSSDGKNTLDPAAMVPHPRRAPNTATYFLTTEFLMAVVPYLKVSISRRICSRQHSLEITTRPLKKRQNAPTGSPKAGACGGRALDAERSTRVYRNSVAVPCFYGSSTQGRRAEKTTPQLWR